MPNRGFINRCPAAPAQNEERITHTSMQKIIYVYLLRSRVCRNSERRTTRIHSTDQICILVQSASATRSNRRNKAHTAIGVCNLTLSYLHMPGSISTGIENLSWIIRVWGNNVVFCGVHCADSHQYLVYMVGFSGTGTSTNLAVRVLVPGIYRSCYRVWVYDVLFCGVGWRTNTYLVSVVDAMKLVRIVCPIERHNLYINEK